jgi:hypothetical protein
MKWILPITWLRPGLPATSQPPVEFDPEGACKNGRRVELIDWNAIEDRTRNFHPHSSWEGRGVYRRAQAPVGRLRRSSKS